MAEILKQVIISHIPFQLGTLEHEMPSTDSKPASAKLTNLQKDEDAEAEKNKRIDEAYTRGMEDGIKKATELNERQNNQIKALINSIPEAINANRHAMSDEIADIVLLIAQQFFINQQNNKESISLQINQLLSQINDKQTIELCVHPSDLAMLHEGTIQIDAQQCQNLKIRADERLTLGGCLIKNEHGLFDAGIERQIDSLKTVLLQIKKGQSL